jgi:hypothetical protein
VTNLGDNRPHFLGAPHLNVERFFDRGNSAQVAQVEFQAAKSGQIRLELLEDKMALDPLNVFISYSHDSPEHAQHVLELAERLHKDGVNAQLDQYVAGTPPEGWHRWMLDQLDWAEYVLMVCTETYYRRFRGHEEPGKGKGADWEGNLITLVIYHAKSRTSKFGPVFFDGPDEELIPEPASRNSRLLVDVSAVCSPHPHPRVG